MLRVGRRLASSSDLGEVLGQIIDALRDLLHAERASVFQYDAETHELFATRAHGLPGALRIPADKGLVGEAATTRDLINIPDAYADPRFNPEVDKATGFRTRCLLTIPLLDFDTRVIGVAQVLNKRDPSSVFDARDEQMASALADLAAVALKRAALLDAQREKERLEADLDVARRIQTAALPAGLPDLAGYDMAGHSEPAEQTGGDAYDVAPIAGRANHAMLFMGDATGHGVGPALSVTQVLSMLRMGFRLGSDLAAILRHANDQLCNDIPLGRFVTAFVGVLDAGAHRIDYISAGQGPLLVLRADGTHEVRGSTGAPMGIDPLDEALAPEAIELGPGDLFLLLSDGYYETLDAQESMFGVERVLQIARESADEPCGVLLERLREAVRRFAASPKPDDDRTAVLVRRTVGT